jgi:hypothetical protein
MTPDELLTKKDLQDFKNELFELLQPLNGSQSFFQQKWLKNEEVKKLMKVSNATIRNLRVNGTLPYNKIGGIYYYRQEDIEQMLNGVEKKPEEEKITPAKTQTFSCRYYLKSI